MGFKKLNCSKEIFEIVKTYGCSAAAVAVAASHLGIIVLSAAQSCQECFAIPGNKLGCHLDNVKINIC